MPLDYAVGDAPSSALDARGIGVHYGGVVAVEGVDLRIPEKAIVGLIGPNGAGKTTLVDALTGYVECSGSVQMFGARMNGLSPHTRARSGLTRTFQAAELFDDMSVVDNIALGAQRGSLKGLAREFFLGRSGGRLRDDFVDELISSFGLGSFATQEARNISPGTRKVVALCRALASRPKMVLLDEPGAGLDSRESRELGDHIARIPDMGASVLLIDHDMELIFGICHEVYVLNFGKILISGEPEMVRSHPSVTSAYLGEPSTKVSDDSSPDAAEPDSTVRT